MKTKTTLNALYSFPGFRALSKLKGILGDSPSRIVTLRRRQKKRRALPAATLGKAITIQKSTGCGTWTVEEPGSTWSFPTGVFGVGIARP